MHTLSLNLAAGADGRPVLGGDAPAQGTSLLPIYKDTDAFDGFDGRATHPFIANRTGAAARLASRNADFLLFLLHWPFSMAGGHWHTRNRRAQWPSAQ